MLALEQRMHDVQAILDEVGSKRTALFGISEGGPMSLLTAPPTPNAPPPWSCTVLTPNDPGRLIILSDGRTSNGNLCSTTSNTIGAHQVR